MKRKIVLVGGGSFKFAPGIMKNALLSKHLRDSEFVLYDPNYELAALMLKLGLRMNETLKSGLKLKVERTRKKALSGADFVFLSINVGGFKAHLQDIEVPYSRGILQSVGDTVGPGGVFRTLRFVPAVLDICRDMEKLCPKALLISYTNPMIPIIQAVNLHTKIRAIGMCHDYLKTVKEINDLFGGKIEYMYAGLNHCVWMLEIKKEGKSLYPKLEDLVKKNKIPDYMRVKFDVFRNFGYIPAAGEKHVAEFFPYYLRPDVDYKRDWKLDLRQDALKPMMKERDSVLADITAEVNGTQGIRGLFEPSRELGVEVIESVMTGKPKVFNINMLNLGAVPNLPADSVLEMPVRVSGKGFKPLPLKALPDTLLWNTLSHSIKLKLAMEAAVFGDKKKALAALLADPACVDTDIAKEMLDTMIKLQPEYLGRLK